MDGEKISDPRTMVLVGAQGLGDLVGYLPVGVTPALGQPVMLHDAVRSTLVQQGSQQVARFIPLPRTTQPVDVEVVPLVWYALRGKDREDNEARIKAEVGEYSAKNAGLSVVNGGPFPQHNGGRPASARR